MGPDCRPKPHDLRLYRVERAGDDAVKDRQEVVAGMQHVTGTGGRTYFLLAVIVATGLAVFTGPAVSTPGPAGTTAAAPALRTDGPRWGPARSVSPPHRRATSPALAYDGIGNTAAVWRAWDGRNWRVQYSQQRRKSDWSRPVWISAPGTDVADPQVRIYSGGGANKAGRYVRPYATRVVSWLAQRRHHAVVMASVTYGASSWSRPLTVSDPRRDAVKPIPWYAAAQWREGRSREPTPTVFYLGDDGHHRRVQMATLDHAGTTVHRQFLSAAGGDARDLSMAGWKEQRLMFSRFDGHHYVALSHLFLTLPTSGPEAYGDIAENMLTPMFSRFGVYWTNRSGGDVRLRGSFHGGQPTTVSNVGGDVLGIYSTVMDRRSRHDIVWRERGAGVATLFHAYRGRDGWAAPQPVSAPGLRTGTPAVARCSWTTVLAWPQQIPEHPLRWRVRSADLSDLGPVIHSAMPPRLVMGASGRQQNALALAWRDPTSHRIVVAKVLHR
ncbi:hypothetical protein [Nocardioides taihuensis]|uniref:Uncharacterized protein n=1 Tax=Nocardioides taihuensis TaxID=1835606 RepID=A0ABW0BD94_9ACTN